MDPYSRSVKESIERLVLNQRFHIHHHLGYYCFLGLALPKEIPENSFFRLL